jgi:hypothetical protein
VEPVVDVTLAFSVLVLLVGELPAHLHNLQQHVRRMHTLQVGGGGGTMVMAARPTLFMVIPLNTYGNIAPTRRPETTMGSRRESCTRRQNVNTGAAHTAVQTHLGGRDLGAHGVRGEEGE